MKVQVDRGRCIGASLCLVAARGVFMLDGSRKAFVLDPAGADDEAIRRAAASCPTGAIRLIEQEAEGEGGGPGRPAPPGSPDQV